MKTQFFKVDEKSLKKMTSVLWCDQEAPLLCVPGDIQFKDDSKFRSCYVLLTSGCAYIFINRRFGSAEFYATFHPLNVLSVKISKNGIRMTLESNTIFFRTDYIDAFSHTLFRLIRENTLGVTGYSMPKFVSDAPLPNLDNIQRPPYMLKNRAICLAHLYNVEGDALSSVSYFDKWEENQKDFIVIGPSFHPGNFAAAIGHAIGWESLLKTVCFQRFNATKFPKLLNNIVRYSVTISSIGFADYTADAIPDLSSLSIVPKTRVHEWCFTNCHYNLFIEVLNFLRKLPEGSVQSLRLSTMDLSFRQFQEISRAIEESPAFDLKTFTLRKMDLHPFPFSEIKKICTFSNITTIHFRMLPKDASRTLHKIFSSGAPLEVVKITRCTFSSVIDRTKTIIPPTLIGLDVSESRFSASTLQSFIELVACTEEPRERPIFLEMRKLGVNNSVWGDLSNLDFDNMLSNIVEVDISENVMPGDPSRFFFAFLYTQRRLQQISMNDMSLEYPIVFVNFVQQLMENVQSIKGLDFSSRVPEKRMLDFIKTLAHFTQLRRLSLKNNGTGDKGCKILSKVIKNCTKLNQFIADGTGATSPDALAGLWTTVAKSTTIMECDVPKNDMKALKIKKPTGEFGRAIEIVCNKVRPSTPAKRIQWFVDKYQTIDPFHFSEVYDSTSLMEWYQDEYDQDGDYAFEEEDDEYD